MTGERVVAVIGWKAAAALRDNRRFLQQAAEDGRVRPREWRIGSSKYRSLVLRGDGSCELSRFSPATLARRLAAPAAVGTERKGNRERG